MHNLYDEKGNEIDAKFSIEPFRDGFDLIIESRGGSTGGRPPRNSDYSQALVLHLRRMAELGMVLDDLQVASTKAMEHPLEERQIRPDGYTLPLDLGAVSDFEKLRLAIGRVSAAYGRTKDNGGNPTKKLRFRILWSDASGMSPNSIAAMLALPVVSEEPTADPNELAKRVERARRRIRRKKTTPPKGQAEVPKLSATLERYVRDPEVIAWVLEEADGKCEYCGSPAPFIRMDGEPFLEVHHVRPLGEGGPDTTDNAAACCPNCHRRLHYDPAKDGLRLTLIASVKRLKDFPPRY
jgi:5-methylcytosine-specific restriction protein A